MERIFVTGIGTEIGKTVAAAILTEALQADYWKPVQAGDVEGSDTETVKQLISNTVSRFHPEAYKLKAPLSPHDAAQREHTQIELKNIQAPKTENPLIIEGAGGLMVPLNDTDLILDLIHHLDAKVVLVSQNYLGSINHTLMSCEILKARNIEVKGIIFNGDPYPQGEEIILKHSGYKRLLHIQHEQVVDKTTVKRYAKELLKNSATLRSDVPSPGMVTDLARKDKQFVWHPYTQMQTADLAIPIVRGEKAMLYDDKGKRYIDAISSWWVNLHGHSHPHIAQRVSKQLSTLEHVIFAGFTHPPAVELASRLLDVLPDGQEKVFYSDNGSTAVEVALKMAIQFWANTGKPRNKIIAFKNSYHGDTFGAMSVSERGAFTQPFHPLLFETVFIDTPVPGKEEETLAQFQDALDKHQIAAFIYEPLVLGTAGMVMYEPEVLDKLLAICLKNGIIAIADEVMTGFGRTGKHFASDYCVHKPDVICLSKGLTGGTMAMGVTTCSSKIYDAFLSDDKKKTFFHGHSYTANPLGCAAALASLDLVSSGETQQRIERIGEAHKTFMEEIRLHPLVANLRLRGTILAFEISTDSGTSYFNSIRDRAYRFFIEKGILIRPLGNVIYLLPPYCIETEQLNTIYSEIKAFLNQLQSDA
ncbi:adenosylmethionine--8-amino-7-oxononanoate transaminase [Negadavirga shengliensis]|uniref:Multifunctional fusion protein n=1 Tax=Negadavirga shengliensis TaxID=1389218 RepID=A0ABV9T8C0_9BACT